MANFYEKQLQGLLSNPNSFQGTPGFQFARDQGLEAATRKLNAGGMGGSGNALAELTRLGTGYAMQDYGNQVDRLGRLTGQQQQFQLGQDQNANQATRNTNDYNLGLYKTSNDFQLGSEQNAQTAQRDWWNANNQNNQFNLGQQRAATDWYNADTNRFGADTQRGNAMANIFFNAKRYGY